MEIFAYLTEDHVEMINTNVVHYENISKRLFKDDDTGMFFYIEQEI